MSLDFWWSLMSDGRCYLLPYAFFMRDRMSAPLASRLSIGCRERQGRPLAKQHHQAQWYKKEIQDG